MKSDHRLSGVVSMSRSSVLSGCSILFLFLFLSLSCYSQKSSKTRKPPPGTVQVNDTLFVDKTEVANIHWREYLYWLSKNKTEDDYFKALQDTSVWAADTETQPFSQYYHRHPSYNNYPAVGISYAQVEYSTSAQNTTIAFHLGVFQGIIFIHREAMVIEGDS